MFALIRRLGAVAVVFYLALAATSAVQAADYHAFLCAIPPGDAGEGTAAPTDDMSYNVTAPTCRPAPVVEVAAVCMR